MKKTLALLAAFLLVLLFTIPAYALETQSASNRFVFDETVSVTQNTEGDLGAFGNTITLIGAAAGDVFAFGGTVKVACPDVGGNVFSMGNSLTMEGVTARNIYAAGNMLTIAPTVEANAAYLGGATVYFGGTAKELYATGGTITIDGTILGNAVVSSDNITVGDSAIIGGTLTIYGATEPVLNGAIDQSKVHFIQTEAASSTKAVNALDSIRKWAFSIVTAAILAVLLTLLFGKFFKARADELRAKVGKSLLWGLLVLIVLPIACILVFITVVGIPVGIFLLIFYGVFLCLAPAYTGVVLGRLLLKKTNRYLSAMAGAAAVRLLMIIPILGTLVYLACAFYTLGSLAMSLRLNEKETDMMSLEPPAV